LALALLEVQDACANTSSAAARVARLQVGNAQVKDTTLNILPDSEFWSSHGIDGILAIDL
jgi:hypothetical protein